MIETRIRLYDNQCVIRQVGGERTILEEGDVLEITPTPGVWIAGTYHYDQEHKEHYWKHDNAHFVGLIDGMSVRYRV